MSDLIAYKNTICIPWLNWPYQDNPISKKKKRKKKKNSARNQCFYQVAVPEARFGEPYCRNGMGVSEKTLANVFHYQPHSRYRG